jgi:hypothetical protein
VAVRAALVELRLAGQLFSNPAVCTGPLSLLESKDSCQIGGVVTAIDPLFRAATGLRVDDDGAAAQVLRYRSALLTAAALPRSGPLSVGATASLARALTTHELPCAPLDENAVAGLLKDWSRLQHEPGGLDPLVRLAVAHQQLAALQPFALATGPVARILCIMSLMNAGLLNLPALNISRYILATKAEHDRKLAAVSASGDWEPFLEYMLTAVEHSAAWSSGKLRAARQMLDAASLHIQRHAPKIYSPELTELIFAEPYTCISHLVKSGIAKRQTAAVYLKKLAAIGILKERQVGRNKVFIHLKYMYLLARDDNSVSPYPDPGTASA